MPKKYKVPHSVKRTIKDELYQYWKNQELLEEMKIDIIEESGRTLDGQPKGNKKTDPTQQKTMALLRNRRIIETERRLGFIREATKRLTKEEYEVFELIFKEGYNQRLAETQKYISKNTYYNTIDKIVYYTALEFGYI